eukprot:Gregarina_sp_Pseudo_9__815@NODE_1521_length_1527_cov_4_719086_g1409_i0_p1_GENE_NODE_1521_length_1527_cov_4_719086_g1409_i0NODE_1521_length_1527_cov_4_719086_g1409_i0_p1_ORF_typecomplete_len500_score122_26NPL4/PF05021_15/6_2e51zfNPL4/PF05020_15/4_1e14UN_NPL4/PF11543_8/1_7e07ubiquitin/PF00240_23/0_035Ubiquitin_2/PF14560_6/0_042_NODE_1521_length_1527_cov_4_719086_g1409_i0151514
MTFVVRIQSNVGRCRLSLPSDGVTLGELKQRCAEKFSVPVYEVGLTLDKNGRQILYGDSKKLRDLGFVAGIELFLHTQTKPVMIPCSQTSLAEVAKQRSEGTKDALSQSHKGSGVWGGNSTVGDNASNATRRKGTSKKDKQKHKFKPFESFLEMTDFAVTNLALAQDFRPVVKNPMGATKLPPTISLKHQPYRHVDHLEVMNLSEISGFVSHWRSDLDMLEQRAAYLIGYYRVDPHYEKNGIRAVVEAIYEPPQLSQSDCVRLLEDDPFLPTVEALAAALGLEIVGWTWTHLPRNKLITGTEVLEMGKLQLARLHKNVHYTGYPVSTFVSMTVSPKDELKGEPAPDAFMISDLGLAMIRDNLLSTSGETADDVLILRPPSKDELMPTILETAQGTNKLDTDWLLVRVVDSAPIEPRSIFKRTSFPRIGRTEPTLKDLRVFLTDVPSHLKQPYERYADFHFLLYVAKVLEIESALAICEAIMTKTGLDPAFEELLKSLDA